MNAIYSIRITLILTAAILAALILLNGCAVNDDKGVGPVEQITLGSIDKALSDRGKQIFDAKCLACHKMDTKLVGPPLKDVTKKRKPEWIMNMIINPQEMVQKDAAAMQLYREFMIPMPPQNVTELEARAILEYFRETDQ